MANQNQDPWAVVSQTPIQAQSNNDPWAVVSQTPATAPIQQTASIPGAPDGLPGMAPPSVDGLTNDNVQQGSGALNTFASNAATGLGKGVNDVLGVIKGIPLGIYHDLPPVQLADSIKQAAPILHAYEQARSGGADIPTAIGAANNAAQKQNDVIEKVKQYADQFKKNPTQETSRVLFDAAALAASIYAGGAIGGEAATGTEAAAAEGAAEAGATEAGGGAAAEAAAPEVAASTPIAKPGFVQRILKGESVAEAPTADAVASKAASTATKAGIAAPEGAAVDSMGEVGDSILARTKSQFQTLDDLSGGRIQRFQDRLSNISDQLGDLTGTEEDVAKEAKLFKAQTETQQAMDDTFEEIRQQGGDAAKMIDEAKNGYKQGNALKDLDAQVFQSRAAGATNNGLATGVDPSKLLPRLQKLYKSGRLQQALGEDNAIDLLKQTNDAVKLGAKSARLHSVAVKTGGGLLKAAGAGAAGSIGWELLH
jgi:hypothetical protein